MTDPCGKDCACELDAHWCHHPEGAGHTGPCWFDCKPAPPVTDSRLTSRDAGKLFTLVRMVQSRLNRGQHEIGPVAFEIQALTWALESLGYPPSRYAEVIRECAPAKVKGRRRSRPQRAQSQLQVQPIDPKGGDSE